MRSSKQNRIFIGAGLLAAASVLLLVKAAIGQGAINDFHVVKTGQVPVEKTTEDGLAIIRLFFNTYTSASRQNAWNGSINSVDLTQRLLVEGVPAEIIDGPERVSDSSQPKPLVLLLAIDVSRTMGFVNPNTGLPNSNFKKRWEPLKGALERFVSETKNSAVFIRLMPWGHEAPYSIEIPGAQQHLELWEGRYLPLDSSGRAALLQGLKDIDTFMRRVDHLVHTALYGACLVGVGELKQEIRSNPNFKNGKGKPVLVLLTDGENDTTGAPAPLAATTINAILKEVHHAESDSSLMAIPLYTIGFGVTRNDAVDALQRIADDTFAEFSLVADDDHALIELNAVYNEVLEVEGNTWIVDVNTCMKPRDLAANGIDIVFINEVSSPDPNPNIHSRMLLYPSALVVLNKRFLVYSLIISGIVLVLLLNIWYFTRPKIDLGDDPTRGNSLFDEKQKIPPVESKAISVKKEIEQLRSERESEKE